MEDKIKCKEANQLDLVDFLEMLGHVPQKIRGSDHWYLSPLRIENTPSFKINRAKNVWYDHGTGEGGTLVDFGKTYFKCTIQELLERLSRFGGHSASIQPLRHISAGEKKTLLDDKGKIKIISESDISNPALKSYLSSRQIPLSIAKEYCQEICFELYNKIHLALGFQNIGGGYELRNHYFKGSSTPKLPRLIQSADTGTLVVFEGFFNFLSYQTIRLQQKSILPKQHSNYLILNSLSFFEKSRDLMEGYKSIKLCLDRDKMGIQCTQKALSWSDKYKDQSTVYSKHKDLNEYLVKTMSHEVKQSRGKGMHM